MSIDLPIPNEDLTPKLISDFFWAHDPKQNFFAHAKNLVIKGILDRAALLQIQKEYGGDLVRDFELQWKEFLDGIAYQIETDEHIDAEERAFFKEHLDLFTISKEDAAKICQKGDRRVLMEILGKRVIDGDLSNEDISHIQKLSKHYGLDYFECEHPMTRQIQFEINEMLSDIFEEGIISDDEWESIQRDCVSLRAEVELHENARDAVDQARRLWSLQFGDRMPVTQSVAKLKPTEIAYFVGQISWYENRKSKGATYLSQVAHGEFVMTNQRVLLVAESEANRSISWSGVLAVNPGKHDFVRHRKSTM